MSFSLGSMSATRLGSNIILMDPTGCDPSGVKRHGSSDPVRIEYYPEAVNGR